MAVTRAFSKPLSTIRLLTSKLIMNCWPKGMLFSACPMGRSWESAVALSETVGRSMAQPLLSVRWAAYWTVGNTLELRASSTTHCLIDTTSDDPGPRPRDSGGMPSMMAACNCKQSKLSAAVAIHSWS